jgi:hypothetical protein
MIYGDIGGIAPIGYGDPSAPNNLFRGVERVPAPTDVRLEPGMEIHGLKPIKEPDDQACGNADAPAQCDTEMGKVAAYRFLLRIHLDSGQCKCAGSGRA